MNNHDHDIAHGYAEGDRDEWSKLSYGGHKSHATGDRYSNGYAHDSGNDFGHNGGFENGFDHGHNSYANHYAPFWNLPYH